MSDNQPSIEQERERLESALNRLENAFRGVTDKAGEQVSALRAERGRLEAEIAELRAARDEMTGKLAAMQSEYSALAQTVDQVTQRLDATIGDLKIVLDG